MSPLLSPHIATSFIFGVVHIHHHVKLLDVACYINTCIVKVGLLEYGQKQIRLVQLDIAGIHSSEFF